jgi:hypothetical protein
MARLWHGETGKKSRETSGLTVVRPKFEWVPYEYFYFDIVVAVSSTYFIDTDYFLLFKGTLHVQMLFKNLHTLIRFCRLGLWILLWWIIGGGGAVNWGSVQFYPNFSRLVSYACKKKSEAIPVTRWRRIGLWDFSRQSAHTWRWGCQLYSPVALYPQEDFWYSFLLEAESSPGL